MAARCQRTARRWRRFPGVGRKTANVVLNVAFGQPVIAVDTHIFRVSNRTGLAPGKTPLAVELELERVVPDRYKHNCHHWLILHGPLCLQGAQTRMLALPDRGYLLVRAENARPLLKLSSI